MHLSKPSKNSAVKTKDHCPQKNLTPDLSWLSWFRDFWEESIFMLLRVFWENSIFVLTRDFPWFIMERTEEIPVYCGHLMGPYNTRHFFQRTVWCDFWHRAGSATEQDFLSSKGHAPPCGSAPPSSFPHSRWRGTSCGTLCQGGPQQKNPVSAHAKSSKKAKKFEIPWQREVNTRGKNAFWHFLIHPPKKKTAKNTFLDLWFSAPFKRTGLLAMGGVIKE